jgi:hypothetical protein
MGLSPTHWGAPPLIVRIVLNRTPSTDGDARDGSHFVAEHSLECKSRQAETDSVRGVKV